jgi:4,5-dihydroxyphthalate decarboxylase
LIGADFSRYRFDIQSGDYSGQRVRCLDLIPDHSRVGIKLSAAQVGRLTRLFENHDEVEREYFQKPRSFPIMHTVVIRRDVYEKNRWIAQSLYKAFARAQQETYKDLYETAALKYMLPWLIHHVEETRRIMGDDYWAYGLEPNVNTLETFLRYSYEQGLSKHLLKPRELFAPESLESFKI